MKNKKCIKQQILDLLRDTEETNFEIALELRTIQLTVDNAIASLLKDGLLVCVDDMLPAIYTSNYDKLKIKVYAMEDDLYEKVQQSTEVNVHRDPLDTLFFAKPDIVVFNSCGYRMIQLSDKLWNRVDDKYDLSKPIAISTEVIKHLHLDIGVPMEELENTDFFKIVKQGGHDE